MMESTSQKLPFPRHKNAKKGGAAIPSLMRIIEKVGIKLVSGTCNDVDFNPPFLDIGYPIDPYSNSFSWSRQVEERLAHELGHFLVASEERRWTRNYGHDGRGLTQTLKEREELAAAVLGMVLQNHYGGFAVLTERAYLWNHRSDWEATGFQWGADQLREQKWISENFELNTEKLKGFYVTATDETVAVLLKDGKICKVFRLPTAQLSDRTEKEIIEVAKKYGQSVEFYTAPWSGVESVKWDIKEFNGDT